MHAALTPDLERFVNDSVESGRYESASQVVRDALQLLDAHDQTRRQLLADVRAGFDRRVRGEGRAHDQASGRQLAGRIKSRGRAARVKEVVDGFATPRDDDQLWSR